MGTRAPGCRDLGQVAIDHEPGAAAARRPAAGRAFETLQVDFDSGEDMRETTRRLHLADRIVAYRPARIESPLRAPIDDAARRRLAVPLLVRRLQQGGG